MNDYTSDSPAGTPADAGTGTGTGSAAGSGAQSNADTATDSAAQSDAGYGVGTGSRPSAGAGRPPLRRAYHGRMLAGVAAGIADYLDVDVTIVRVAFAVATVLGGVGVPAYLACLFLIPEEGSDVSIATDLIDSIQSR
jgi:phage shock protein C